MLSADCFGHCEDNANRQTDACFPCIEGTNLVMLHGQRICFRCWNYAPPRSITSKTPAIGPGINPYLAAGNGEGCFHRVLQSCDIYAVMPRDLASRSSCRSTRWLVRVDDVIHPDPGQPTHDEHSYAEYPVRHAQVHAVGHHAPLRLAADTGNQIERKKRNVSQGRDSSAECSCCC